MARDKVFISYSHKDRRWFEALQVHLEPLERDGSLDLWIDTRMVAGDRWRREIASALDSAKVAVLLVSPDFLASRFVTEQEVPELLKTAESDGVRVLCLFVRPSLVHRRQYAYRHPATGEVEKLKLTEFQGLNSPKQPLSKLKGNARETAMVTIAEAILDAGQRRDKPSPAGAAPAPEAATPRRRGRARTGDLAANAEAVAETGRTEPVVEARRTEAAIAELVAPRPDAQSDAVAWAHLSDFHFKVGQDYGRDEVLQALLKDLAVFAGKGEPARGAEPVPLDFVVVTGDVAYGGKANEYVVAAAFLREVSAVTGVPPERVFVVPGNHDVDRDKALPPFMRASLDRREHFEQAWRLPATRRSIFADKLAAYRGFVTRLNPTLSIPEEQPGGFCQSLECNGRTLALLGLSSAWMCGADGEYGRLITGKEQAYDLAAGAGLESLAGADLKLALMHHPLDWMQEFDKGDMSKLLAGHVDMVLRGHVHETGVERLASPGRELRTIAAGSSYAGSRYRNTYNVTQVRFGDMTEVKVWLRAYVPGERCYTKDVETYAEVDDGTWTWELPGKHRPAAPPSGGGRPPKDRTAQDARPYLEWLWEHLHWLDIRGIGAVVAQQTELDRVYTRLRVAAPGGQEEARAASEKRRAAKGPDTAAEELRPRDLELKDLLQDNPRMVLVGDPGAGKTTFLKFVALNLASALLAGKGAEREACMARIGLTGEPPFPILVSLGLFGQFLRDQTAKDHPNESPEHFYRYLDFSLKGYNLGLPVAFLRVRALAGGCLLLLDGLDEVPAKAMRERVGRILDEVVGEKTPRENRHLVTCRTRAYQGKVQLGTGFTRSALVDFGPREIEEFVTEWSRALRGVPRDEHGTAAADRAARDRNELLAAIRAHPHVRPLTTNPLMLTILAVVHWNRKKLPEQRADLYEAAVDYLIESRKEHSAHPNKLRKECYQAVALRTFEDTKAVRKTLDRAEAAEVVMPLLGLEFGPAMDFIAEEELYSGILVSRTEGSVEFWHPTFAEYMAALSLSVKRDYWAVIRSHLFEERWSEVVLLLAGCLRRLGPDAAAGLIRKVLAADKSLAGRARAVGLVGRILRDIEPYGGDPSQGTGYQKALRETLAIFEKGRAFVPGTVRVEVGEALGQSGDPRIADDDHANRVLIPGGSFWMGAQKTHPRKPGYDKECFNGEGPVHRVTVSDFFLDRYPVTVLQFRRFVEEADAYLNERFWSSEGWAWREDEKRTQPAGWEEQLRHPNRPVVSVSWYEAEAYCAWLSQSTGRAVSLPTEGQWEFAARGPTGRKYPWGDPDPTDQHANFRMCVGHPTPVGIYPLGATPEGVQDLAGNVWEWCRDWFGPYSSEEQSNPPGPPEEESRLLRGGGFNLDPRNLRAAYRTFDLPEFDGLNVGFRCVVVGAGAQKD